MNLKNINPSELSLGRSGGMPSAPTLADNQQPTSPLDGPVEPPRDTFHSQLMGKNSPERKEDITPKVRKGSAPPPTNNPIVIRPKSAENGDLDSSSQPKLSSQNKDSSQQDQRLEKAMSRLKTKDRVKQTDIIPSSSYVAPQDRSMPSHPADAKNSYSSDTPTISPIAKRSVAQVSKDTQTPVIPGPTQSSSSTPEKTPVLDFLQGDLKNINPQDVPVLVASSKFIADALSSPDILSFMDTAVPVQDLLKSLNINPNQLAQASLVNDKITPNQLLAMMNIDPQRVTTELSLLASNIQLDGFTGYMDRAKQLNGNKKTTDDKPQTSDLIAPALVAQTQIMQGSNAATDQNSAASQDWSSIPKITQLPSTTLSVETNQPQNANLINADMQAVNSQDFVKMGPDFDTDRALINQQAENTKWLHNVTETSSDPFVDLGRIMNPTATLKANFAQNTQVPDDLSVFLSQQSAFSLPVASAVTTDQMAFTADRLPDHSNDDLMTLLPLDQNSTAALLQQNNSSIDKFNLLNRSLLFPPMQTNSPATPISAVGSDADVEPISSKRDDLLAMVNTTKGAGHLFFQPPKGEVLNNNTPSSLTTVGANQNASTLLTLAKDQSFNDNAGNSDHKNEGRADTDSINLLPGIDHTVHGTKHTFDVAAPEIKAPAPSSPNELIQKILDHSAMTIHKGGGSLRLDMSSPELGKLDIALKVKDNKLDMRILAASDHTRNLIMGELPKLKESLTRQNINLNDVEVAVGGGQSYAGSFQNGADQRGGYFEEYKERELDNGRITSRTYVSHSSSDRGSRAPLPEHNGTIHVLA